MLKYQSQAYVAFDGNDHLIVVTEWQNAEVFDLQEYLDQKLVEAIKHRERVFEVPFQKG